MISLLIVFMITKRRAKQPITVDMLMNLAMVPITDVVMTEETAAEVF